MINRPEYLKAETECNKNYLFHFLPSSVFVEQATCLLKQVIRKLVAYATIIVEQATCLFKFTIQRRTSNLLVKAGYSQAGSLRYDYCRTSKCLLSGFSASGSLASGLFSGLSLVIKESPTHNEFIFISRQIPCFYNK